MIRLSDLLSDHQEFHSELQMNSFITIRSGGTLYGCYKQALRELSTRKMALIQRYTHCQVLQIELDDLRTKTGDLSPRDKVSAVEKRLLLEECSRVIADTEREFIRFYEQAVAIREALRAQGVNFPLDADTRNQLDCEMWEHQLKCMAAVDFIASGRLGAPTVGLLQSCPAEMRGRIAKLVLHKDGHRELVDWFLSYDLPMPAPELIEAQDVRKLLGCSES